MNRTTVMRIALWIGALFNFGAALMFIFPASLGQMAGLPASGSLFYNWLLAVIPFRGFVVAIGDLIFGMIFWWWLRGELGDLRAIQTTHPGGK